jgi:hypothetical protein
MSDGNWFGSLVDERWWRAGQAHVPPRGNSVGIPPLVMENFGSNPF